MPSEIAEAPALAGEVMFYKRPEPLHRQSHQRLGLTPSPSPFGFARNARSVPVIVSEFGPASLHYPIVFAGPEHQPLAVLGLRDDQNLFIDADGAYAVDVYVPAFIRRYPFVYAHGDEDPNNLVVCIDRGADMLVENGEIGLFSGEEPSAYTKQCMDFLKSFEEERRKTEMFTKRLRDLDLFELRTVNFTPTNPDGSPGTPLKISEHFSPSEAKLKALSDADQLELLKSGALQQIHMHWNSLNNWVRLIHETLRRNPGPTAA